VKQNNYKNIPKLF